MWRDPYCYVAEFVGANALAANGTRTARTNIDREADFGVYRMAMLATDPNVRAQWGDQNDRKYWEGALPGVQVFGTGQIPAILPAARVVKRTDQIGLTLTDASGAPNTVRVLYIGAQLLPNAPFDIPPFEWGEPYILGARFGGESIGTVVDDAPAIPANGNNEFTRRVPGDSWFEVHALTITRLAACTIQILTNGSREWFRLPVHVDLLGASTLAGAYLGVGAPLNPTAAWPFTFSPAKLIPPNHGITVRIADLSGAPNTVRVGIHGIRRYS
jgi:hypothetical protein